MATIIKHTFEMHPMALMGYLKDNAWGGFIKDKCVQYTGNCVGEVDCDTGTIVLYLPSVMTVTPFIDRLPTCYHTEVEVGECSIQSYRSVKRIRELLEVLV